MQAHTNSGEVTKTLCQLNGKYEFALGRPAWQQDLVRRLCTQSEISAKDFEEILANLKAEHGLMAARDIIPLAEHHLSQRNAGHHETTKLAEISGVENANQLASNQHLVFALNGITLIYGDNGSGKTGYARILKQLCRARRDKQEPILGNVYKKPSGPAEAKVTYLVGDKRNDFQWEDGKPVPAELSRISCFRCCDRSIVCRPPE